jgi:putative inorganic carbon (hco3(-)) transporter
MRDIAVAVIVFGLLPWCLARPYIGVLLWTWLSLMNPHKLAWGFATNFPFAYIVAIVTLIGLVISRDPKRLPIMPVTVAMGAFIGWMCVTSFFALYPDQIGEYFTRAMKVQLMIFVTLMVLTSRRNIEFLVWVSVASIAFFGIKGGIFTLTTGGGSLVYGPPGGFFFDNNALAVTLIMIVPLMFYMYQHAGDIHRYAGTWLFKSGLVVGAILCAVAALGSHSRGGLLAIGAMFAFLWWRSRHKLLLLIPIALVGVVALAYMPEAWWQRMISIAHYEADTSAMGRINAWWMAWNLALDRFTGGGFYVVTQELFDRYSPNPADGARAAHSIYFQVLGEHGFVGLGLFLLIWATVWRTANKLRREAKHRADTRWAADLAAMVQVSLVGYFVGGAFLSLSYFDLPYLLAILVVAAREIVKREFAVAAVPARVAPPVSTLVARSNG